MGNVDTMYDFDWAGAEREYKRAIEINPNYAPAHENYAWLLTAVGRLTEAVAESQRAEELDPRWSWASADAARAYALSGRREQAQRTLDELLARSNSKSGHVSKYALARLYAALGDKRRALDELEQSFAERSFFFDFMRSDPEMDGLRSEPRFQDLVRRMNFPQ